MLRYLAVLLVFIPISIILARIGVPATWVFLTSAIAIIPLAGIMSEATEELAKHMGATVGGLLNATFGNATELIITLLAVHAGELDVVRSSIIGSIIGNILLVLGLAIFVGGIKFKSQKFNQNAAGTQSVMLILAVVTLLLPSLFIHAMPDHAGPAAQARVSGFGLWVAGLLMTLYISNLIFSLVTHREIFTDPHTLTEEEPPHWSKRTAFLLLAGATLAVAVESNLLVSGIAPTVKAWGLSKLFVGVILIPIIGNAAEHATAVVMAVKDRIDVTLNICVSSSTQIDLFVAPLIVFVSVPLGHPLRFVFNDFEIIAVGFAAWIAALIARDGESNWFEGAQLLILYAILAIAFYFVQP